MKYWPQTEDESQSKSIEIDGTNHTIGNVLPGLVRDVDYNFQVNAELTDGKWLTSDTTLIHTPAKGMLIFTNKFMFSPIEQSQKFSICHLKSEEVLEYSKSD